MNVNMIGLRSREASFDGLENVPPPIITGEQVDEVWRHLGDGVQPALFKAFGNTMSRHHKTLGMFQLHLQDLHRMMIRSGGRCEVSGIPFNTEAVAGAHKRPFMPSIDRINSALPYTRDNCRLVCVAVNVALNDWGDAVLRRIAEGIVSREK